MSVRLEMEIAQNIRTARGSGVTITLVVANQHGVDVASAFYAVRCSSMHGGSPLISKSLVHGINVTVSGKEITLTIDLNSRDTALLDPGEYYHEAAAVLSDGAVVTLFSGQLRIDPTPS
jgi:hypothetical protein